MEATTISKHKLLQNSNGHMQCNYLSEFEINNLPSFLENQREAQHFGQLRPDNVGWYKHPPRRAHTL
jgi:hypothetical protein